MEVEEAKSTLAYGKTISEYAKSLILEVVRASLPQMEVKPDDTYDSLMNRLGLKSPKELGNYIMNKYGFTRLTFQLFQTYSKVKPLEDPNDWFDTSRLNGICSSYDMVMWKKYDRESYENDKLYVVNVNPKSINESVELNWTRVGNLMVNELRKFIIENGIYQSNEKGDYKPRGRKMSMKEICDECYLRYPYYFCGAHGCDVFEIPSKSLSIMEITQFLHRYPSAIIGYILNTETYKSRSGGQHWVSLTLSFGRAQLICSFGSSFSCFMDDGALYRELMKYGYSLRYSMERLQKDHHTCGMFSGLSCYLMLCNNCDLDRSVEMLGVGGSELVKGKGIQDFVNALAFQSE